MELKAIPLSCLHILLLLVIFQLLLQCSNSSESNEKRNFKLTVIVLTMNRPKSLVRLLNSIRNTDFEEEDDKFDVEIHVDKSFGLHYKECVE